MTYTSPHSISSNASEIWLLMLIGGFMHNRDRNWESDEYERWHRMGKERGWFDKTRDEISSWFGDDDAERRRRMDRLERFDRHERSDREYDRSNDIPDRERTARERMERERMNRQEFGTRDTHSTDYDRDRLNRSEWERPVTGMYSSIMGSREYTSYDREPQSYGQGYGRPSHMHSGQRPRFDDHDYTSGINRGRESDFYTQGVRRYEPVNMRNETWQQQRGGRGPKNYRRNDERILDDIHERMDIHHEIDAREIEVEVKEGDVTLKGTVYERRDKRLAEEIAESVFGVKNVHNMIKFGDFDSQRSPLISEQNRAAIKR